MRLLLLMTWGDIAVLLLILLMLVVVDLVFRTALLFGPEWCMSRPLLRLLAISELFEWEPEFFQLIDLLHAIGVSLVCGSRHLWFICSFELNTNVWISWCIIHHKIRTRLKQSLLCLVLSGNELVFVWGVVHRRSYHHLVLSKVLRVILTKQSLRLSLLLILTLRAAFSNGINSA